MGDARDTAQVVTEQAKSLVTDAANQVSAAAGAVYNEGNEVADVIEEAIRRNPWSAVLLAGAIGYGIARLSNWR